MRRESNKKWRSVLRAFAAGVLMLAVAVGMFPTSVNAEGVSGRQISAGSTGTITVTGIGQDDAGNYDTVVAYKVIDITYDAESNNITYDWVNDTIQDIADNTFGETDITVKTYVEKCKASTDEVAKFYAELLKAVNSGGIGSPVINSTPTPITDGTAVFPNLTMGQYMIFATGVNVYEPMAVTLEPKVVTESDEEKEWEEYVLEDQTIAAKTSAPTVDKKIEGENGNITDNDSVAINDPVNFVITTQVPNFPADAVDKRFILKDTMDAGLEGVNDLEITAGETVLTEGIDYTVTYYSDNEYATETTDKTVAKSFVIKFNTESSNVNGTELTVRYTSKATAEIVPGTPGTNEVTLEWPKNIWTTHSDFNEKPDEVKVYTYGIKVLKTDDSKNDPKPLKGAEFKLYSDEALTKEISFYKVSDGEYRVFEDGDGAGNAVTILEVDETGNLTLDGLDEGTYYLKEVKAPTGYVLSEVPIPVTIKGVVDDNGVLTGTVENDTDAYVDLTFENSKGFNLPSTGGMGTVLFSIAGIVLMAGAAVMLIVLMRKRRRA